MSNGNHAPMTPHIGPSHGPTPLPVSAVMCRLAYVAALAAAALTVAWLFSAVPSACPLSDPLWVGFASNLAGTLVVYVFSFSTGNSSVYDPYWVLAPQALTAWWTYVRSVRCDGEPGGAVGWPQYAALGTVWLWASRFHVHPAPWPGWAAGLEYEDWRYGSYRSSIAGPDDANGVTATLRRAAYWVFSWSSFHLTPTLLVFFNLIPAGRVILDAPATPENGPVRTGLAVVLTIGAVIVEAIADEQLKCHRVEAAKAGVRGTICRRGLWRLSRHPNYFGELMFHVGLFCQGWANGMAPLKSWMAVPAVVMFLFFRFASVPLMDKRSLDRRKDYREVMATTPALFPRPWIHQKVE